MTSFLPVLRAFKYPMAYIFIADDSILPVFLLNAPSQQSLTSKWSPPTNELSLVFTPLLFTNGFPDRYIILSYFFVHVFLSHSGVAVASESTLITSLYLNILQKASHLHASRMISTSQSIASINFFCFNIVFLFLFEHHNRTLIHI